MGGPSEKLLTLEEAARRLDLPADDVEVMIRERRLAAFRLGGTLLRIRLRDVELIRDEGPLLSGTSRPPQPPAGSGWGGRRMAPAHPFSQKPTAPVSSRFRPGGQARPHRVSRPQRLEDRIVDFFYFNDFYLVAVLILLTLLAVLLTL